MSNNIKNSYETIIRNGNAHVHVKKSPLTIGPTSILSSH